MIIVVSVSQFPDTHGRVYPREFRQAFSKCTCLEETSVWIMGQAIEFVPSGFHESIFNSNLVPVLNPNEKKTPIDKPISTKHHHSLPISSLTSIPRHLGLCSILTSIDLRNHRRQHQIFRSPTTNLDIKTFLHLPHDPLGTSNNRLLPSPLSRLGNSSLRRSRALGGCGRSLVAATVLSSRLGWGGSGTGRRVESVCFHQTLVALCAVSG